jgi:type I restriction enzyme S subunit
VSHLPAHWAIIPSKYLFRDSEVRKQAGDVQLTASQKYGIISQEEYMERENAKVVLANQGLDDWKHVEPYDFVISLRSFQGGLEMSETTGCITWHYVVLKATKPIYPKFYKWLFKSSMYITAIQRTCNFIRDGQDLRYSNFSQVPLYEPPLEEQKEIADYLDKKCAEIDAVIASKQKQLETLDAYKKSLIFEYVTGKKEVL